ncbi:MAG: PAS domain-containing protein [Thermoleophilaceae bacterium]
MADRNTTTREDQLRAALAAYNRGDLRALLACYHDDVEIVPSRSFSRPGTAYRGKDGLRTIVGDTIGSFPGFHAEFRELRDLGDWVLASVGVVSEGPLAGPEVSRDVAWIFMFEDALIRRAWGFTSEEEAVEAAERPTLEEFRAAFDGAPVATALVDDDGCFREVNAAAASFFGEPSEALRHRALADFVPPPHGVRLRQFWHRMMDGDAREHDFALRDGDGTERSVELQGRANYMPGCHLISFATRNGDGPAPDATPALTPREREIFQLLALGFSGREIAERLVLSPDTIRTHVQNGISRLGAKTRAQAIAIALTRGDISL